LVVDCTGRCPVDAATRSAILLQSLPDAVAIVVIDVVIVTLIGILSVWDAGVARTGTVIAFFLFGGPDAVAILIVDVAVVAGVRLLLVAEAGSAGAFVRREAG